MCSAREVYIVEAVRTPIAKGRENGALHSVHPVQLVAHVLKETLTRAHVSADRVEDVIIGCVTPLREQGANIARLGALQAGFPVSVPGVQLNRMCGSGQQSIHFAAQAVASGDMDIVIGGGVEMMGTVKMGSDASDDIFSGKSSPFSDNFPYKLVHQGVSAELVAAKYGITRAECDDFAAESHRRADKAQKAGYWNSQIVPVPIKDAQKNVVSSVSFDEGIRWPTEVSTLAKLPSIFKKNGVVHAGNASQVSDGASAVLLASGEACDALGLRKRARFVARVVTGSDPTVMLDGVIPATLMVLKKSGLKVSDIDVFEINEAFASVVLAWQKVIQPHPAKVNPNGGAIAHGHPLGATGAALMTKLLNELERTGGRYGLQTMCIGHGMATATIIERLDSKIPSKL